MPRFSLTDASDSPLGVFQSMTHPSRIGLQIGRGLRLDSRALSAAMGQGHPWAVADVSGATVGTLLIQHAGSEGHATLYDVAENPVLTAHSSPQGFGGYALTSNLAGTPYLRSQGKINHGMQEYRDSTGAPVARVHFPSVAAHETLYVDLVGTADPAGPLVLAFFVSRLQR